MPDIDWVKCPGGDFVYQDGAHCRIETFHIARYPVTQAQFQAFLTAPDGYPDDRWWTGLTDPERTPGQPRWDLPNHPRETVSWHEAMAFCAWLSDRLGFAVTLPTEEQWERAAHGIDGYEYLEFAVTFPTEEQWEGAAHGIVGHEYPWGRDYRRGYANIDETFNGEGPYRLGQTSAVGAYPEGASPEGVLDLAGNVWEWCVTEDAKSKRIQPGGTGSRVLRGGSWLFHQHGAQAAYRLNRAPRFRGVSIGFRVLCVSPIL